MEKRALSAAPELRADGEKKTAKGYALLFNVETRIGDWFREVIAPGAFTETINNDDIRALVDHDTGRVIGRKSAGTLRLNEDAKGVAVEIDLPDTTDGRDLAVSLDRGDISGMSFSMHVTGESWEDVEGDIPLRTITKAQMGEVSAVAFPQYEETEIALRSLKKARETQKRSHNFQATRLRLKGDLDLRDRS